MDEWTNGRIYEFTNLRMEECTNLRMEECTDGAASFTVSTLAGAKGRELGRNGFAFAIEPPEEEKEEKAEEAEK